MTTSIIHLAVGLVLLVAVNIVLGGLNALFDGSFDKVKLRNGIIKGITPTIFGPYNTCTRAHIVTFLHRYSASILAEAPAET